MEALYIQPMEKDGIIIENEEEQEKEAEEGATEASSPGGFTTDEESDEDSEPEPPPVVRRKVSFADAFGLNLVSVKEFDNVEMTSDVSQPRKGEATYPLEEFYMSCLFAVPSSAEELDQRLQAQMVELESIELLPGTTTLRGIIRVVNLCYAKSVYARITLDHWNSYFDLLAEYVPGSSDRKTDRFSFKYALVPPFEREGTRVEFCLRYETSVGSFWANNKEINYVLFCHQKGQVKECGPQALEESSSYKSKRSCLKANRRGSTEDKTINTATAEAEATFKAEESDGNTTDSSEIRSLLYHKGDKSVVDTIKKQHRPTRLTCLQDYLSQRGQQIPKAHSPDSVSGQKVSQHMPAPWGDSASLLYKGQKKHSNEGPQVLTYHQIPLLTLDWNNDKPQQWDAADVDDIWSDGAKKTLANTSEEYSEDSPLGNDLWETLLNGTDGSADKGTSVCDVWQAFLNGPHCKDHSVVPESEWLQTAALVSPSNDKEAQVRGTKRSQDFQELQVGTDAPTALHAHAVCQLLSDTRGAALANVAVNTEGHQSAEGCGSSTRDDNTVTRDAPQRSQTHSVTDTLQEFSLEGATAVSEGYADSSTKCHKHVIWERGRKGIIGEAEGIGGDEPFTPYIADLVTSSGESKTTDMTAMPESQNARTVDMISQGARLDEGLSSSAEGEVTGTAHNAMHDTLAFRETIRQETKDGERIHIFSTSRHREEGRILTNCKENKVPTEEEIFAPPKTEVCEISQRYADEKQCEENRLNQKSENPSHENEGEGNEIRPVQPHTSELNPKQTCEENFGQSQIIESELKLCESYKDLEELRQTEVEMSYCSTRKDTKGLIGAENDIIQVLAEESWHNNDKALTQNLSEWQRGGTLIIHNKQLGEEFCVQKKEEDSSLTQREVTSETGKHVFMSNLTEEGKNLSCGVINVEKQEINPSSQITHTMESRDKINFVQSEHDPTDKCSPNPAEVAELRWTHSQDVMNGQEKDVGSDVTPEEVTVEENAAKRDTSTEVQHQPETLGRTGEDVSHKDKDERVSGRKLKIDAEGDLMGNVDGQWAERKNTPAKLKEQVLSAEVERHQSTEYKKVSEGTEENTVTVEVMESGLEKMLLERFGEDLVRGVCDEVFCRTVQDCNRDRNIVAETGDRLADVPQITHDCHLLFEKDFIDAFDSGVFSLTDLPADPNVSLCQDLVTGGDENSPEGRRPSITTTDQTHFHSELQTDLNTSAHLSQDLTATLPTQSRTSLTESAQTLSSPEDQEDCFQIKERSVPHQETGRQTGDCVVAQKESFNRLAHPSQKHMSCSSEKSNQSDGLMWWSVFYILSHMTRLIICALLVAGFFVVVFLYDFPAFFVLYICSLSWWFYKWKRCRVTTNKEMTG